MERPQTSTDRKSEKKETTNGKWMCWSVLFIGAAFFIPMLSAASLDPALEQAILAEDWERIVGMLPKEAEPNMPAPLRLIKGHACLATNRNNESLCLFLSASSEVDRRDWDGWSKDFLARNPRSPIAYYFVGDSQSRMREWSSAVRNLNHALTIHPNHILSLNMRAVVYAHQGKIEQTRADIKAVLKITRNQLSDAWANLGYYWIQRNEGSEGAIRAFSKALEISPDFALAYHGRGCARLILRIKEAQDDFNRATKYGTCAEETMKENYSRYVLAFSSKAMGADPETMLANLQGTGTTLNVDFQDLTRRQNNFEHNFRMADAITTQATQGNWDMLPFGGHIANGIANRFRNAGIEELRHIRNEHGTGALGQTLSTPQYQDLMPSVHDQGIKIKEWNPRAGAVAAGVRGAGFGTAGGAAVGQQWHVSAIGAGVGSIGAGFESSSNKWNNDIDSIMNAMPTISPINRRNNLGGVSIDFAEVLWDDGDWPFLALYALAYSAEAATAGESTR